MQSQKFGSKYILRIDKGEEIVETLKQFCKNNSIVLGSVIGIGAVNEVTIGLFETASKEYHSTKLTGDFEITNLTGNISLMNEEVYLHLHITIGNTDSQTFGGHLNSAVVSATCEIIIDSIDGKVSRQFDPEIGLNLFNM